MIKHCNLCRKSYRLKFDRALCPRILKNVDEEVAQFAVSTNL